MAKSCEALHAVTLNIVILVLCTI